MIPKHVSEGLLDNRGVMFAAGLLLGMGFLGFYILASMPISQLAATRGDLDASITVPTVGERVENRITNIKTATVTAIVKTEGISNPTYIRSYKDVSLPLMKIGFANSERYQIVLNSLRLDRVGNLSSEFISNIRLFDMTGQQVGLTFAGFGPDDAIQWTGLNVVLPPDYIVYLTLKADVAVTASFPNQDSWFGVQITSPDSVGLTTLKGNLSLQIKPGAPLPSSKQIAIHNGGLVVTNLFPGGAAVSSSHVEIARWNMNPSKEVEVKTLVVRNTGNATVNLVALSPSYNLNQNLLHDSSVGYALNPNTTVFIKVINMKISSATDFVLFANNMSAYPGETVKISLEDIEGYETKYGLRVYPEPMPVVSGEIKF